MLHHPLKIHLYLFHHTNTSLECLKTYWQKERQHDICHIVSFSNIKSKWHITCKCTMRINFLVFINSRNTFENKWNYPIIELLILNSKKMTKVKNVNGTSRFPVPSGYDSWLDYWEKQTGKTVSICGVRGCSDSDLVGGHVMKVNSTDKHYYITPICRSCNTRTDEFYVCWDLVPVPSNL